MLSFSQLILISYVFTANANVTTVARISFAGERAEHRPVRDPDGPLADGMEQRRTFWHSGKHKMCRTAGCSAGALAAHRITASGQLSPGQHIPGHVLLDLRSFVSMVAGAAVQGLDTATHCPLAILQAAAEDMCLKVICGSGGVSVPRERCLAYALHHNGVLKYMPKFKHFLPKSHKSSCSSTHFNFKISGADFNANPQLYVSQLVTGVYKEVSEIHEHLVSNNATPIELPPLMPQEEREYIKRVVQGAVIGAFVGKAAARYGKILSAPAPGNYDANAFFSYLISQVIRKIPIEQVQEATRVHNVALKMALYWVLNNFDLLTKSPVGLIAGNSLMALGLGQYFPTVPSLVTNNSPVNPKGRYVFFPGYSLGLEPTSAFIGGQIPLDKLRADIAKLLPTEQITVPEEVITMLVEPLAKPSKENLPIPSPLDPMAGVKGAKGALPKPEEWFSINAPTKNASNIKDNAVLLATLATIIGAHAGWIMPKMGIITLGGEKGYQDFTDVDAYEAMQKVNQQLLTRLMSVIPLSLDTGFAILNGAFKTTKMALNLQTPDGLDTSLLIPLGLKQNEVLKFYPNLQGLQWDLYPLPDKMRVIHLWVKPNLGVNLEVAMDKKITDLITARFPKVLQDIVAILHDYLPDLTIYNIRALPDKIGDALPWDPPEAISYLYDPSYSDGVATVPYMNIEAPKRSITCPGHFMCPADQCVSSPCGHYVCLSSDPWCYFPEGIACPGSIQCPVVVSSQGRLMECPGGRDCPITGVTCPGGMECPDSSGTCPGRPNCPLLIRCPGSMCPTRYSTRPVPVLPCPQHPLCQQPLPECLLCQSDLSCSVTQSPHQPGGVGDVRVLADHSDIVAAIKEAGHSISASIDKKEMKIEINNTAVSHVSVDGQRVASGASGTVVRNDKAAAASGASASAGRKKDATREASQGSNGHWADWREPVGASAAGSAASSPGTKGFDYGDYQVETPAASSSAAQV